MLKKAHKKMWIDYELSGDDLQQMSYNLDASRNIQLCRADKRHMIYKVISNGTAHPPVLQVSHNEGEVTGITVLRWDKPTIYYRKSKG